MRELRFGNLESMKVAIFPGYFPKTLKVGESLTVYRAKVLLALLHALAAPEVVKIQEMRQ